MKNRYLTWIPALIIYLAPLTWVGCGNENDSASDDEDSSKTTPSKEKEATSSEEKAALDKKAAQAEATTFFEKFTSALRYKDSYKAVSFVAPDHRVRFGIAYPFWHGCRFYDAKVVEVSGDLMRVQVSFEWPSGKREREIKKLKRVKGKWRLLDS
ncbi:MAG: hypothetical protein VCA36_13250 [Opitutales bacterium]